MTDTNPLAPIEALADEWERNLKSDREDQRACTVAGEREAAEYWAGCADTKGAVMADLRAALAEARQAVDALARWKSGALPVLDGLQEIGHALGLPLGEQITGPAALTAIEALVAERDSIAFIHEGCAGLRRRDNEHLIKRAEQAEAERDAAREALARVEALADRWVQVNSREQPTAERFGGYHQGAVSARGKCLDDLRAALAQPATDEHECDSGHFDRTFCPEPCGMMHSYCATCGKRADACAHDPATDEEAGQ